jgi:hypothetical protein
MAINPELVYEATTEEAYPEVEAWCIEHVGPWNEAWVRIRHDIAAVLGAEGRKQIYYFRREQDCTMFILRWGS